jgi:hypothetical protein
MKTFTVSADPNYVPERERELMAEIERLREALEFYADPETYFAIACIGDPPCGDFIRDFSDDHGHPQLDGMRYGKRARAALKAVAEAETEPKYVSTDLAAAGTMAAINKTIKRCAQVARTTKENTYPGTRPWNEKIADAILALREEGMSPTQAQIDAHKRAYWETWEKIGNEDHDACLRAALTAAAEVGPPEFEYVDGKAVAVVTGPSLADVTERAQEYYEAWVKTRTALANVSAENQKLRAATKDGKQYDCSMSEVELLRLELKTMTEAYKAACKLVAPENNDRSL